MPRLPLAGPAAYAALLALASCSNVDGPPHGGDGDPSYFPNGDGARWAYHCQRYLNNVPHGDPYDVGETFDGDVVVNGVVAQRLVRYCNGADQYDLLFLTDDDANRAAAWGREFYVGSRMVGACYFDPSWSYLLYPLRVNYSWSEVNQRGLSPLCLGLEADVDGDGRDDTVDVEIIRTVVTKEELTLPMGSFQDCYKIRRTVYALFHMTQGGDVEMDYVQYGWFKPSVGFIQYTGDEIVAPNAARYTFLSQLQNYFIPAGNDLRR